MSKFKASKQDTAFGLDEGTKEHGDEGKIGSSYFMTFFLMAGIFNSRHSRLYCS